MAEHGSVEPKHPHGAAARATWIAVLAAAVFASAIVGMLRGVEPFATWFYPLAWYPTLVLAEVWLIRRRGRGYLTARPRMAVAMLAWSVPFWLLFELINFRVENWYYVFVPHHPVERWAGIMLSFATVVPAVFMAREVMRELGVGSETQWSAVPVRGRMTHHLQLAGVAFAALSLLWPLFFFPLVWGAVTLLLDPWVHRRDPSRSLLGALEEGRPAVILQLLAGGLAIGFLWELYNVAARGKWIYTVPGLEELKLFEMPVLGFLGFPVLALDAWAMWQALELTGLAPTSGRAPRAERKPSRHAVTLAATLAVLASGAVLLGMQRFTITSTTPVLEELVGEAAGAMQLAGHDVFSLAESEPEPLAAALGVAPSTARRWIERAELVVLRGIGVDNARQLAGAEIATVGDLARADAAALARRLGAVSHSDRARVRLWVRAAQEATERPPPPPPEP